MKGIQTEGVFVEVMTDRQYKEPETNICLPPIWEKKSYIFNYS